MWISKVATESTEGREESSLWIQPVEFRNVAENVSFPCRSQLRVAFTDDAKS